MKSSKRIYIVTTPNKVLHLVKAYTRAAARSFVAAETIQSELASQDELVNLTRQGVQVRDSTTKPTKTDIEDTDITANGSEGQVEDSFPSSHPTEVT